MAPLMLIVFSVVGLAVPTWGVLQQTALAQPVVDVDADTLVQETRDEVEQEIEQEAEQEAEQEQEQEQENEQSAEQDNAADVSQDESNEQANVGAGDNNVLTNDNEFGVDDTLVDQDNLADQDAVNVGVQEQDLTQDIEQDQDAANVNIDFDFQYGFQIDEEE